MFFPFGSLSLFVWAFHMVVYHGVALGFEALDRSGRLRRFRVRRPERRGWRALLPLVLFNQCCILLPAMLLLERAGLAYAGPRHLNPVWFVACLPLMGIGHDVVQYAGHAAMHRLGLRFLGHRVHHGTGASRAVSACYMHPADFVFQIVLPYLVPLVLVGGGGADVAFHLLTVSLGAVGGLYEHSGYDFAPALAGVGGRGLLARLARAAAPLASSHAHGQHHRFADVSFSDGFGSPGLCDTLLGTRWDRKRPPRRGAPPGEASIGETPPEGAPPAAP
ncbi:MAG: fatty acid hydroxylase family protein [Alphaproteobacteria bacterium]|nr:fatty acid hydroxylase family protein [Alphaproteobacteria bacterium]